MKLLAKISKSMKRVVFGLLMLLPVAAFGQIKLEIPEVAFSPGDTLDVPVYVSGLTHNHGVTSGEFEFSLNTSYFNILSLNKTNTLLEQTGNVVFQKSVLRFAFAGTDTLNGQGVFIYLKIIASSKLPYFTSSALNINSAMFNEGEPEISEIKNGLLRIKGVRLSPKGGFQITAGATKQFTLSEDVSEPVIWAVSNSEIGSIDVNGLFTAISPGVISVKAIDAAGLSDSSGYFTIFPETFNQFQLSLPELSVKQTMPISVPVTISNVTGLGITSAQFEIGYNTSYLKFQRAELSDITAPWGEPAVREKDGIIQIAVAGTDTLKGGGRVFILHFMATNERTGRSHLRFNSALFKEDLKAEMANGYVDVIPAPNYSITPLDTTISVGEQIDFSIVDGGDGTAPYSWESTDSSVATFDNTGRLTALSRGVVTVQARDKNSFLSHIATVTVNDFNVYVESAELKYPNTASLALFADEDLSAYSVYAFESEIEYDGEKLSFTGVQTENTQTGIAGFSIQVRDTMNTIRIAGAGTQRLTGTNPLIQLKFDPKSSVTDKEKFKIDLKNFSLNEPSASTPIVTPVSGFITINRVLPPGNTSLVLPKANSTNMDTTITFNWSAVGQADSYKFQLSENQSFTELAVDTVLSENELRVGNLKFSQKYYWHVVALNEGGQGAWSAVRVFTTKKDKPGEVQLITPSNEQILDEFMATLKWSSTARADSFLVQVSTDDSFSPIIIEKRTADTTSITPKLNPETAFYWRVRAENEGGAGSWSDIFSFSTPESNESVPHITKKLGQVQLDDNFGKIIAAYLPEYFADDKYPILNYEIVSSTDSLFEVEIIADSLFLISRKDVFGKGNVIVKAANTVGFSVTDTLSVEIKYINKPPIFVNLTDTLTIKENEEFTFNYHDIISDHEDELQNLHVEFMYDSTQISITIDKVNGTITIKPTDYIGKTILTIKVEDSAGATAEASIVLFIESSVSSEFEVVIPSNYALNQNYPNPFNPSTNISFDLPESGFVRLEVFNMLGQKVQTIIAHNMAAGSHKIAFDASRLSSGFYLYKLQSKSFLNTKKMVLIK